MSVNRGGGTSCSDRPCRGEGGTSCGGPVRGSSVSRRGEGEVPYPAKERVGGTPLAFLRRASS